MTVSEMLDLLESRIATLGAERARLVSALDEAERRLKEFAEAAPARKARRKQSKQSRKRPASAKAPKTAKKAAPQAVPETATPLAPEAPPAPARPTGKRLALGRGLAQLRARTQIRPQPADITS